tara:strand:- start:504 stop:695 length:192 start_codon:yes stop_codon:yes gene_type:complete
MKDIILKLIEELNSTIKDVEKVENQEYGYKSAAVRARKVCQNVSKELKELRKQIQELKNNVED